MPTDSIARKRSLFLAGPSTSPPGPYRRIVTAALICLIALLATGALADETAPRNWEQIRREEGITTWRREQPGQQLAIFRARSEIPASLWDLIAVLEDVNRASEWTANCEEMRRISRPSDTSMLVYARMDAPWPVRDRDVITEVTSSYAGPNGLFVAIRSIPYASIPEHPGLVRIPRMVASYRFESLGEQRTRVEYQIDLDPGGTLPDWLKTLIAKDLAHNTLSRLRERVRWAAKQGLYHLRAGELERLARARGFDGDLTSPTNSAPNLAATE